MTIRLPGFMKRFLVKMAGQYQTGRRELYESEPRFCRLVQLAIIGCLAGAERLTFRPFKEGKPLHTAGEVGGISLALVMCLTAVGVLIYLLVQPFIIWWQEGILAALIDVGVLVLSLALVPLVMVVTVKTLEFTAWTLTTLAKKCPIRVHNLGEVLYPPNGSGPGLTTR